VTGAIDSDQLLQRFAQDEVAWLARWFRRALEDNPDGQELLTTAVLRAARLGVEGWTRLTLRYPLDGQEGDRELWARWQAQRELTPEAERWPERLAEADGPLVEQALDEAEALLLDAGAELGMTGAVSGRRARRALADIGRQAAEAGATLAYVLATRPEREPQAPRAVPAEPMRWQPVADAVKVATTSNLAECELLQGMLANAGIPSAWRRAVMHNPDLLAAGERDIFVPPSAAEEARIVLATVE
jgi:hypothetical protein